MKYRFIQLISFAILAGIAIVSQGCGRSNQQRYTLSESEKKHYSYAFGISAGNELKKGALDFDQEQLSKGIIDGLSGMASDSKIREGLEILSQYRKNLESGNRDAIAVVKDLRTKASYAYGQNLGALWNKGKIELDGLSVSEGLKDFVAGKNSRMSLTEACQAIAEYNVKLLDFYRAEWKKKAEKNLSDSTAFLDKNKNKPGIQALPCGLQYKVLATGQGASPEPDSYVTVEFRGTLLDGTEIENSRQYDQPCIVNIRNVIEGWSEALQVMKPGDKWELYISPQLAYGSRGDINVGPNAALIFTMELKSVLHDRPAFKVVRASETEK
jgi:FKBP-type peptidyl-prolyl cis-trans isomerase FklB